MLLLHRLPGRRLRLGQFPLQERLGHLPVTGIGGIFFKSRDPQALAAWYQAHLGIPVQAWGGAVLSGAAPDEAGGPKLVWFRTLNTSPRNCRLTAFASWNCR